MSLCRPIPKQTLQNPQLVNSEAAILICRRQRARLSIAGLTSKPGSTDDRRSSGWLSVSLRAPNVSGRIALAEQTECRGKAALLGCSPELGTAGGLSRG